jgi:hypothetical protein
MDRSSKEYPSKIFRQVIKIGKVYCGREQGVCRGEIFMIIRGKEYPGAVSPGTVINEPGGIVYG